VGKLGEVLATPYFTHGPQFPHFTQFTVLSAAIPLVLGGRIAVVIPFSSALASYWGGLALTAIAQSSYADRSGK
jgi:hypothetical protein